MRVGFGDGAILSAIALTACLITFVAPVSSSAPQSRQEQPPRFRAGVHVLQIDATILDRNGLPVRGLRASDVTILEDGQPRQLVGFTEVVLPDSTDSSTAWRKVGSDVIDNQAPDGRLLVLVMDDAMLPPDAAMLKAAKEIARGAVQRMSPADRMAVVFTNHNRHAQDFTGDRARLLSAIETTSVGFAFAENAGLGGRGESRLWNASLRTLLNIAEALSSISRRRKAIIYVSIGIPLKLSDTDFLRQWRELFQAALGSNTAIYAFDPSGAGGLEAFAATRPKTPLVGSAQRYRQFLEEVASNTGGRATLVTNEFAPALARMFDETSAYYLLAYESAFAPDDGRFHRLEIKTNRPDTTVRARSGYFGRGAPRSKTGTRSTSDRASLAIADAIPQRDLPMQAMAAPFATSRSDAAVAVVVGLRHQIAPGAGLQVVDLVTGAFEQDGRELAVQRQTARLRLRDNRSGETSYEILTLVKLKPGNYRLRIGAHNAAIDKSGSVFVDVDVPDFGKDPLSRSGLDLSASSAPLTAPADALRSILPIVPTTLRHFARHDRVTAFLRVYQKAEPVARAVTMSAKLSNIDGQIVYDQTELVVSERFTATRSADFSLAIPVSELASGTYLLEVDARAANVEPRRRQVTFQLR